MKPDSMIVDPKHISAASEEIASREITASFDEVSGLEPALASYIGNSLTVLAGKMALSGAPTRVVHGVYEDVLALVLTCVRAQRRGHYELWMDVMDGSQPAPQVADDAAPSTEQRVRKRRAR